ncbi:MAG: glycoside hydrolase family 25 protein [Oscillospiraceae bacterium]|jgi:GH25 family lysozyme M1 (1,4-beta-N-acetylmuramidase)|nr:glycoside hydrolase family 25 protein [Oscillospiraceae bacterium]
MRLKVIDVSEHQGRIDWKTVAGTDVVAAMIRDGYGVKAANQVDAQLKNNVEGCKTNGVLYGFYHYSYAKTLAGVEQEAQFCLENIAGVQGEPCFPVAIDMEEAAAAKVGRALLTKMALRFCELIKKAGYIPLVYCNLDWARNYLDIPQLQGAGIDLWLAEYTSAAAPNWDGSEAMWQYSSKGKVRGISGNVDLSWCFKDFTLKKSKPAPAPAPAAVRVGSKVRVKNGARDYTGKRLASFVFSTIYTVLSIRGNRVVIGLNGKVTAAVRANDLYSYSTS